PDPEEVPEVHARAGPPEEGMTFSEEGRRGAYPASNRIPMVDFRTLIHDIHESHRTGDALDGSPGGYGESFREIVVDRRKRLALIKSLVHWPGQAIGSRRT